MTNKTLVEQLVDFACAATYETLPDDVVQESKRALLDSIGVGLAAVQMQKCQIAAHVADSLGGGKESTVFGSSGKVSTLAAAFANGELISALDFDVLHVPPGHVSPYVLPAILAFAEKHLVDGRRLICAISIAHEICVRFGPAMAYYRDLKPGQQVSFPAVMGYSSTVFGGTLGSGLLMGLNATQLCYAAGIAGRIAPAQSMTQWARSLPATDEKYLMAGWINQAQVMALLLAEGGYRGDIGVLDGDFGFARYMGSSKWNPESITEGLGDVWRSPAVTIYKPYPHCRITHTALDCLRSLMDKNDLKPEEINEVRAYCDPHCANLELWQTTEIISPMEAQMSVPWAISMAAHRVQTGPEWQDTETIANGKYRAFMRKVKTLPHARFEQALAENAQSRIGKVEIDARGTTFTEERWFRKGSPATEQTKMTDAEIVAKFEHNASRVLSKEHIELLVKGVLRLEDVEDFSELAKLWTRARD
jgi:2-methylcitrate dehydratase PrpD